MELWRGAKKVVGLFFAFCGGLARYQKSGRSFFLHVLEIQNSPKLWELWTGMPRMSRAPLNVGVVGGDA